MCNSPVVVQFGLQFFLITVHFNSFGVKMNSIDEISSLKGLIALIPVNISCGCKKKQTKSNLCQSLLVVCECIGKAAKIWRFKIGRFFFLCQLPLLHLHDLTHPLKTSDDICSLPPSPFKGQTPLSKFKSDFFG